VILSLSLDYLLGQTQPSWRDIAYGLDHGLLDPSLPSRLARHRRTGMEPLDSPLWTLADQSADEPTSFLVVQLAALEPPASEASIRKRWYALLLLHLADLAPPDPLPHLEEIWCTFEHPAELSRFIPYMPAEDPVVVTRKTRTEILQAMREAWVSCAMSQRPLWLRCLAGSGV